MDSETEKIATELKALIKTKVDNYRRLKEEMPFLESTHRFWKYEYEFIDNIYSMPIDELKGDLETSLMNIISMWYWGDFDDNIYELYKKLGVIYFGEEFVEEMDNQIGEDV